MRIPPPTEFDGFASIWDKLAKASYKEGIGTAILQNKSMIRED